ncbi:PAS domain S-box protein [Paenibacillus radicis (ex Xue et al. 2023)]|uniref:histidine kinase n=1 Tax=Paenibacillus radicis (ex Xue et al. 2023) TaxID=2972489 RepID=A0ABT1YBQ7_9BACL|nr:PAS domain S-box protein [Paenibacillus radicis (ex Xue et al. 2023)]MCR8629668.1 PAS domain S-box protein [Paenibacillus radicis (ex Xue et al. 2023)]
MRIKGKGINLPKVREALRKNKMLSGYELCNRNLLDGSAVPTMVHDGSIVLYVNAAFVRMMEGFSPEEYTGKFISELFAEQKIADMPFYAVERSLIQNKQVIVEVEASRLPTIFHGEPAQLMMFKEAVAQTRTEEELRSVKHLLHSFVENTTDGIVIVDRQGLVIQINEAFERLHGWKPEEVIGKALPMVPDFLLEEAKQIHHEVSSGKMVCDYETYKLRKDGSIFPVSVTVSALKDSTGNIIGFVGVERDITQSKMIEQNLRLAQEELATAIREQQGLIFKYKKINDQYILTLCDGELLYRFGLSPEELIGKQLWDIIGRGSENLIAHYECAINEMENVNCEACFNGITYISSLRPIIQDGVVVEIIGSCVDLTERKQTEIALQESEERFRQLVELSPAPIIVYGEDCSILFVNGAAVNLLAATEANELIGKSVEQFVHSDSIDSFCKLIKHLITENSPSNTIELRMVRRDGSFLDIEARGVTIMYSDKKAVQFLCHDIRDRKIAEETLRESDRRYQMLLKLSPEPTVAHDGEMIVYANDAAVRLLGAESREELIGKSLLSFFHPDYLDDFRERMRLVKETDSQLSLVEAKLITLNNEVVETEGSSIYVYKHLSVPLIQSVFRDITERKRTEEMIIRSEKLSIVGQLAAGVAHEIRNPLTTLKGFTQLLKAGKRNDAYIDLMQVELERINQIVSEFMVIAKPQNVELQQHDLYKIIDDVIQFMEMQAIMNKVEIKYNLIENVTCICNQDQLKQVFINILKNAIEAMPNGGNIDILMSCTEESIDIQFIDYGTGIPQEILSRLGEPFFTTKETGTGLGIMVCQKIIEAHKGTMQIESELNKGTKIMIVLPNVKQFG